MLEGAFSFFAVGMPMGPGAAEAIEERVDELLGGLAASATGTVYLNFAERGGSARTAYDPEVYERLRDVRAAWDPRERFVATHRIAPRGATESAKVATAIL